MSPARGTFFDGWVEWYWRDTSAGYATAMALQASWFTVSRPVQVNGNQINMYGDARINRNAADRLMICPTGVFPGSSQPNVDSNGVYLSVHGNYYGGIYYSTTSQFVGWSQTSHKRDITPLHVGRLWNRERRAIKYQQMTATWDMDARYTWHEPEPDAPHLYGFDVDEWAEDFPELVVDAPGGIKGLNYVGMIPVLWEALRELRAEVQALKEARA